MTDRAHSDKENARIQGLIGRYLGHRSATAGREAAGDHIDEDSLSAFAEGRLMEREALPLVTHLSNCGFCRQITVELVRLDLETAEGPAAAISESRQPARISDVLSGVLSRIFGTGDAAVFAHEERKELEDETEKDED